MQTHKAYILSCIQTLLRLQDQPQSLVNSKIIDLFLSDRLINTLTLSYHSLSGFKNYKAADQLQTGSNLIHISKSKGNQGQENPSQYLSISLRPQNPLKYLLKSLKCLYNPLVRKQQPQLLSNFDYLRSTIQTIDIKKLKDQDDLDINKIQQEFIFWQDQAMLLNNQRCKFISQQYTKIQKSWNNPDIGVINLKDTIDTIWNCLINIWQSNHSYNQKRLHKVVSVFQNEIITKIKDQFSTQSLWSLEKDNKIYINETIQCCNKFVRVGQQHSKIIKKKISSFNMKNIVQLQSKLSHIVRTKNLIEELNRIHSQIPLSKDPYILLDHLKPFNFLHPLSKSFNEINNKFRSQVQQILPQCSVYLKKQILNVTEKFNPHIALSFIKRWQNILLEESIKNQLRDERQKFCSILVGYWESILTNIQNNKTENLVDRLSNIKNIKLKNMKIDNLIKQLFEDVSSYDTIVNKQNQLEKQLSDLEKNSLKQIKNKYQNTIKQQADGYDRLVGKCIEILLQEGLIIIKTPDSVLSFIKDMKSIHNLGYIKQFSSSTWQAFELTKRFYKQHIVLKQLANNYNSTQNTIMQCQRSMVEKQIIQIQQHIKFPKGKKRKNEGPVIFDSVEQLQQYILTLTKYQNNIIDIFKKLFNSHKQIQDTILSMLKYPLTPSNYILYNTKIQNITRVINNVSKGRESNQWRQYWDYQLSKVLQNTWKEALLQGNKNKMTIELNINANNIEFKPQIELIKQNYYNEIQKFIGWPTRIEGFLSNSLYVSIPDRNQGSVSNIYINAQKVFIDLQNFFTQQKKWQSILKLDVQSLDQNLSENQIVTVFEFFKTQKQSLYKMPDYIEIDTITVNLISYKQLLGKCLDQQIQQIVNILKSQVKKQAEEVDKFVTQAIQRINKKPTNMEQMAEKMRQHDILKAKLFQIQTKVSQIQLKNRNIKSMTGVSYNISNMQKRWQNLDMASKDYDRMLGDQKQNIRTEAVTKIKGAEIQASGLMNRWEQIKPKTTTLDKDSAMGIYHRLKDWQMNWSELQLKVKNCITDCQHFGMKVPNMGGYEKVKTNMEQEIGNWKIFADYNAEHQLLGKQQWITFRGQLYKLSDLNNKYKDLLKKSSKQDIVSKYLRQVLDSSEEVISLMKLMGGQNFERQHWSHLFYLLGIDKQISSPDKLLVSHLLESDILQRRNQIKQLEMRAKGQITIRDSLAELQVWSDTRFFELSQYTSNGRVTSLIKQWKDLMAQVSDRQALIASLRQSKFAGRFKQQVQRYQTKLLSLYQYLEKLNLIQRKWVYLQPIFNRGALPEEQGRWKRLDDDYRNTMTNISKQPRPIQLCSIPGFRQLLNTTSQQLQRCQKALNDFLQQKRNKFPRFYFLGDDDLLQILGQAQNHQIIQQHLKKLFSGIHTVTLEQSPQAITQMNSSLGQKVKLSSPIIVNQIVQKWLDELSKQMVDTLKKQLKKLSSKGITSTTITQFPSQIICLCNQIQFEQSVPKFLQSKNISKYITDKSHFLAQLTLLCHKSDNLTIAKLKSLILDIIHQISILNQLKNNNVLSKDDWLWRKQLKFRKDENNVAIFMGNTQFLYTFQYQGNASKLVHTPLTDKCYLTLTQAMNMGFGGNPYGPAGTGKTQSVKALAQAFGRQCLVFNCDEGIDEKSMGRIFTGLVKCGAWGCFDQFNRLRQDQLSAISQQIQLIMQALKIKQKTMMLLNKQIEVNPHSGIFVTLNPAGKGYGGRSKLPDNLKQLFRPVAMSVPDNELIAEVLLFAEGFKTAPVLSKKIITVFTLCKQLLSKQQHYDWGLRALKTILTVAGRLIFQAKGNISESQQAQLLIKAVRINTLSKLTFVDFKAFLLLINDVFPGIEIKDIIYQTLTQAIKQVFSNQMLSLSDIQLNKILQFYQATKQRIGAVIVGPSGCGKTTIWKTLKAAYQKLNQKVQVYLINPKAMPRTQLLGDMNKDTRQFAQGVLSASARQVIKSDSSVLNWIICDGDIDPQWIQSLNSVLDDNHLLTLPTGERISFGSNVNFIFETDNLQFASPATISRMGMIFLNLQDINLKGIIHKWLKQNPNEVVQKNIDMILFSVSKVLSLQANQAVQTTNVGLLRNVLSQLHDVKTQQQFLQGLFKGLSTNYLNKERNIIYKFIYKKSTSNLECPFDFYIDQHDNLINFQNLPTKDNSIMLTKQLQSDLHILKPWIRKGQHIIIVGKQGCGKGVLTKAAISYLSEFEKVKVMTIHCNTQTSASSIVQKLLQICQKSSASNGKVLRPLGCNRQIIILKQINLPNPDKYKTIQLVSFLQSAITHKGFYDSNLEFIHIGQGIQFICIMKPETTLGRHHITSRFVSNMRILMVDYNSVGIKQNLKQLTPFASKIQEILKRIQKLIQQNFRSDDFRHYLFTPRDLNCIGECLKLYDIDFSKQKEVLKAISYEVERQFSDRLVNEQAKYKFRELLKTVFGQLDLQYFVTQSDKLVLTTKQHFILGIRNTIQYYERQVRDLKVVLIDEVLHLFAGIQKRILEGGSILLAGQSGNFRRSTVNLLSFKHKIPLLIPTVLKESSIRDFNKDLKQFIEIAAGQNKKVLVLFEDHNLQNPQFAQKVNTLISSGQIPGLFTVQDIQHCVQDIQQLRNAYPGKSLYESFTTRIKQNMIVVISLDHRNLKFNKICSSNPAFLSNCRIIWMSCCKPQSLKTYALKTIGKIPEADKLIEIFIKIHEGSMKTFCDYIKTFSIVFESSIGKKGDKTVRLSKGLNKLAEAEQTVQKLNFEAQQKKKLLAVKQKQADSSLTQITQAMAEASINKTEAQKLQKFLSVQQSKIQKNKDIVQNNLEAVQPLIDAAKKSVGSINRSHIDQLRSFISPHDIIKHVLRAVLYIFGNRDESWNSMKTFLKTCVQKILSFDINGLRPDVALEVQSIMRQNPKSFDKVSIYKASSAAGPLAQWTKAIVQYCKVYQKIKPLHQQLQKIQGQLNYSRRKLKQCSQKLQTTETLVKQLNEDFSKKILEAETLKKDLLKAQKTVQVASELLDKLKGQKVRWENDKGIIKLQVELVPKYSVLAASYITYMSQYPQNIRMNKLLKWNSYLNTPKFNFLSFMSSQSNLLLLTRQGLPHDILSLENSQMILTNIRVPLILDPNIQASSWLKTYLQTYEITNQDNQKFMNQIQLSLRFGKTLIVQDIREIRPVLIPILKKDLIRSGPRHMILIGDKHIDYSDNFRIYLTSRDNSLQLKPSQKDLVAIVNFSVTKSGLQGKLLSIIINHQQPELEKKKQQFLLQQQSLKLSLSQLEEKLLQELAQSSGNILQNQTLITSLNETKQKSSIISISLEKSKLLQQKLDQQRQIYKPLSQKGAIIHLTLERLKKLSSMYKYSLTQFIRLFQQALEENHQNSNKLQQTFYKLIKIVYNHISIGLSKSHRLVFAISLVKQLFPEEIIDEHYMILLGNTTSNNTISIPKWLNPNQRQSFQNLTSIKGLEFDNQMWQNWYSSHNCEDKVPSNYSNFVNCLIVQACRPQRSIPALTKFCQKYLKLNSLSGMILNFQHLTSTVINKNIPALFIVSPGFDPSKQLQQHAQNTIGKQNYKQMSMGGNQNNTALELLREASKKGQWLCLKNLHLVIKFLPILEKQIKDLTNINDQFRLFLTTQPHDHFPNIFLENCFKISYEAPPGLKKNLNRLMSSQTFPSNHEGNLLFVLCYFHALIQQRRNYIPQGWTKTYQFNYGDFRAGHNLIQEVLGNNRKIDWQMLVGLLMDTVYGGRIDNQIDLKILQVLLKQYFSQSVLQGYTQAFNKQTIKNYLNIISNLPENDTPDLFGLPESIDKTVQRLHNIELVTSLKTLFSADVSDLKFNRQKWSILFQPIFTFWKAISKSIEQQQLIQIKDEELNSINPINNFIMMQAQQCHETYKIIKQSFHKLMNVTNGSDLLTTQIQEQGRKILINQVPAKWMKFWQGSQSLNDWLKQFKKKMISFKNWIQSAQKNTILQQQRDLSQLFHPQIIINALRQKVSRQIKVPIDQLVIKASFGGNVDNLSIKIKNILLQGCILKGGIICEGNNQSQFISIPSLKITLVKNQQNEQNSQQFPLYSNPLRQKLLCKIKLKTDGKYQQKIKAGVALFLKQ